MAERPIFQVIDSGPTLVKTHIVHFAWFPGMALKQAQKSIESLHLEAKRTLQIDRILEISTKSPDQCGVSLSAFNLTFRTLKRHREFSVESAFQSSKVFENGGPYKDLLRCSPRDAKTDPRLTNSGRLKAFRFFSQDWLLEPKTAFYDWLYINALLQHEKLAQYLLEYSAFSDIAFNPERSINCQAHSAALFVALYRRNLIRDALADKIAFLKLASQAACGTPIRQDGSQEAMRFE
jgi:hypothetical protein